tara:strand:+ start:6361 stop:7395 length:1035 start_codon:yes stop_codon:yes gene_type:complete
VFLKIYRWLFFNSVLFVCLSSHAKIFSPFNNRDLNVSEEKIKRAYRFLLIGHAYGSPKSFIRPPKNLINNIKKFNQLNLDFVVLLGDIVQKANAESFFSFEDEFAKRLNAPVFNAVGNHDYNEVYKLRYGKSFYSFMFNGDNFLFLNSNINLSSQVNLFDNLKSINRNIFVFTHHLIWTYDGSPYEELRWRSNNPWHWPRSNFYNDIVGNINKSANSKIIFAAGDIGFKFSTFFESTGKVDFIASGIGRNKNDAVILVDVDKNGEISYTPISLTGKPLKSINTYDLKFWKSNIKEKVILPSLKKKTYYFIQNYKYLLFFCYLVLISLCFHYRKFFFSFSFRKKR